MKRPKVYGRAIPNSEHFAGELANRTHRRDFGRGAVCRGVPMNLHILDSTDPIWKD